MGGAGAVTAHPAWCARGHRCGLGEHRAAPIVVRVPGAGRAVITRARAVDGHDRAEVLLSVPLSDVEGRARWQLGVLLAGMGRVLGRAQKAARPTSPTPTGPPPCGSADRTSTW